MDTIGYYNKYASAVFEQTVDLDMEAQRKEFTKYLEEGDSILDLGCGSGRDSLAFYEQGFDVTALDASEEMCKLAEIHTDLDVLHMAYEDMDFDEVFDGVWGNEALIHEPEDEMPAILEKVIDALRQGGILYLSFQEGDFEGTQNGRYFCEYTQEKLERILRETKRLEIEKIWVSGAEDEKDRLIYVLAKKIA
ncbi:MAG: class I SAM-dependent methyltransferase [Eubacteriales bacterium]|nr:class I SAM-dependent methyltransferase [Eubacteriales bacterium]